MRDRIIHGYDTIDLQIVRVLGFMLNLAKKRFDGKVPEPGKLDDEDPALLEEVEAGFETVGELYIARKFRAAPSVPSGQGCAKPWPWPARPTMRQQSPQFRYDS